MIQTYYSSVVQELSKVLEVAIPLDPRCILLGIPTDIDLPRRGLLFANLALMVAERDVAGRWGSPECPTIDEWHRGMDM